MNNDFNEKDNLNDKKEKSLLKDMAKKGISKKIKAMPLKTKLIIGGIILGVVLFMLLFVVLISPLMMLLLFGGGSGNTRSGSNLGYIDSNSEDNYWWPVGGTEVEEKDGVEYATGTPSSLVVTSEFSPSRTINGVTSSHTGMDIGASGNQTDYVIASMKGIIYSTFNGCNNNGYYQNKCGGGYGNHIVIEHANGVYTVYAHLYPNSIRVSQGDTVNQGQIIAEMGNSGSSTGKHLHIGVEVGGRGSKYAVNPREYIFVDNPRPVTVPSGSDNNTSNQGELLTMLRSWEGTGTIKGDNYVVYPDSGEVLTVGHGVTLINNKDKFKDHGIDISKLKSGSEIKISIVDAIELEILEDNRNYVNGILSNNNITLESYQVDALIIRTYNTGNIKNFPTHYKQYGNTEALYDNYMSSPTTAIDGTYLSGLARRREAEWKLFNKGIYTYN